MSAAPTSTKTNSKAAQQKPYLILISLDGFRWDYVEKYQPPHLTSFIKSGVKAESLVPSFPTETFPNHYTIATGLYPDNHGIVGNIFYDYEQDTLYNKRNSTLVQDGRFYGGSPIWLEANKADMVTASYFFVGTEADIQGVHPTYYYKFDNNVANEERVDQTLRWLQQDDETRPHLITQYFGDIDRVGHMIGTSKEEELKEAIFALDKNLGDLFEGVAETGLPVNIMIVSDHGMTDQLVSNIIPFESFENEDLFTTINSATCASIHPHEHVSADSVLQYLRQKENHFTAYKTEDTPGFEYNPQSENWGPIQVVADYGYCFWSQRQKSFFANKGVTTFGIHGHDSKHKEMHGIFYASGPAFKDNYTTPSFKNIHVYPLMCEVLGLNIPTEIDGNIDEVKTVLK